LLFTAAHEGAVVLHRRPLDSDVLTVIDSAEAPDTIDFVTTSPFPGGGVAWTRGRCGPGTRPVTRATRGGRFVDLEGTPVAAARPVGWLPDGSLVATDGGVCAGDEAGRVVVFKDGEASVLTASGRAPAVRAALPPPPEPPAEIPDQAPA
ncbi:MAG TPA: hypothetical protein VFO65_01000, partial [Acidimicrobiales bacterium]|nr:hypothetical protein [Acidimicrobiales bacterium]